LEITLANTSDTPQIVALLKLSLGEKLMPKSEAFWNWKHEQNPFGKSKILVAKENNEIIGVRAFMRWNWENKSHQIKAVRAVDTATHPSFQGKGIFTKLTMAAVDACKIEDVDMVFNTPNTSSMPGYLKMGWQNAGKIPLFFRPGSLFPRAYSQSSVNELIDIYKTQKSIPLLIENFHILVEGTNYQTAINFQYLNWRYNNCPVADYGAVIENDSFGFVFRLKKINKFIELRICESWVIPNQKEASKKMNVAIQDVIRKIRPLVVSSAGTPNFLTDTHKAPLFFGPFSMGPNTTIRALVLTNLTTFDKFNSWSPSLGSMELF
jgi:GNAT superfamily N-acetyltransferase